MTPALAPLEATTQARVRDRLARTGRAQVVGVLEPGYAHYLRTEAVRTDYNVATRMAADHVDSPATWLTSLEPWQREALRQAVQAAATHEFHYLIDNHPIHDLTEIGAAAPVWTELMAFLNAEPFLRLMRELTGEPRIAMADAEAEAFTPRFNTLNLLKVPARHSVTRVALFADTDRISVTGWLRGAQDARTPQ